MIAPRGHLKMGEQLNVTANAFLKLPWNATDAPPPQLMVRSLANGPIHATEGAAFQSVPMAVVAKGRHVWRATLPANVTGGDFEYYVTLRDLAFPTLGAKAAIAVVVV